MSVNDIYIYIYMYIYMIKIDIDHSDDRENYSGSILSNLVLQDLICADELSNRETVVIHKTHH